MPTSSIPSTFSSGMTDSFQKTLPSNNKVSASPAMGAPPASKVAPGLSRPANSIPNKPNQVTTSGAPTPQAQANQTATVSPTKVNATFSIPNLSNLGKMVGPAVGSAINIGQGAYNAYQQSPLGMLSGLKDYLGNSTNFANTMGMMAPIAAPLMQTAGLPLLFGAYSALKDKNYLNDLTAGRFPKMGAALPPVAPVAPAAPAKPVVYGPAPRPFNFKFRPGTFIRPGPLQSPDIPRPVASPPPEPFPARDAANIANVAIGSAPLATSFSKSPVAKRLGKGLGVLGGVSDLFSVPERIVGLPPRTLDENIKSWEEARFAPSWLNRYREIYNNPEMGAWDKAREMTLNTLGNPGLAFAYDPVGNAFVGANAINNLTGAGNAVHALSGGRYGQPASGNTLSVPAAVGQMMHLSHGKGKPIGSLHR